MTRSRCPSIIESIHSLLPLPSLERVINTDELKKKEVWYRLFLFLLMLFFFLLLPWLMSVMLNEIDRRLDEFIVENTLGLPLHVYHVAFE